jgi:Ca2+-binding EF-hand superfamily protein
MGGKGSKPDFKELSKGTKYTTKELEAFFKQFKQDFPDGKITKQQFVKLYQKMFQTDDDGDATEFCGHVFRQYDKDNNGVVDFREFVTAMSIASKGTAKEKLHWSFQLYDKDASGFLTEAEVVEVLSSIYKSRGLPDPKGKATQVAKEIFQKADDSKDGKLSEVEFVKHSSNSTDLQELFQGF